MKSIFELFERLCQHVATLVVQIHELLFYPLGIDSALIALSSTAKRNSPWNKPHGVTVFDCEFNRPNESVCQFVIPGDARLEVGS